MPFCDNCGTKLGDGAKFCSNCGAALNVDGASADTELERRSSAHPVGGAAHPVVSSSQWGGFVLPATVLVALLVIAYFLLNPMIGKRSADSEVVTTGRAVTGGGNDRVTSVSGAGAGAERSVDAASRAADSASGRAIGTPTFVSAWVLDAAFYRDPAGAAIRYAGPLRVSGTVAMTLQPGSTPSLSLEGRTPFNYMIVNFPEGYGQRLAPIVKGQIVSVSCDGVRTLGGTTILLGCLLV